MSASSSKWISGSPLARDSLSRSARPCVPPRILVTSRQGTHTGPMRRVAIDPIQIAEPVPPARLCDHPGCAAGGDFRAPRSRIELDHYFWFCLDHVRAYNAAWNYYAGMSEAEVEAEIRHDTTWQRPTWPLGSRHSPNHAPTMRDYFGVFGDHGGEGTHETPRNKRQLRSEERR